MERVAMLRLGLRLSSCLQYRVFAIPWMKRASVTRTLCSEQRDYSSSGPMRYVPKQSRKIDENVTSEPVTGYEKGDYSDKLDLSVSGSEAKGNARAVKEQNQARRYKKISSDDSRQDAEGGNYNIKLSGSELRRHYEVVCHEVRIYTEEDDSKKSSTSSKQAGKTTQDAETMAIQYLGLRAYSAAELRKKLIAKRFPPEIVDGVIVNFRSRGLINDGLYAESYSRSRWSSSSWGPRRIKQALYKKGVGKAEAEAAIKQVFEDEEEKSSGGGDEEPKHGMSEKALEELYVQASKQWLRGRDAPTETRKARLLRWLQYRGFNWAVISLILKRLQQSHRSF